MSGSNGISSNPCKWCGHAPRLDANDYCSPDCYHASHDAHQLHQTSCYDRDSLQSALEGLNATLEKLNGSLHGDGLDGESVHSALRETAAEMKIEASRILEKIQRLNEKISNLESRF